MVQTRKEVKMAKKVILTETAYNVAKDVTTIYLPAMAVMYSGLAIIWGWPASVEVVGSIGVIVTFLGVVLKIDSKRYANRPKEYDGALVLNDPDPNAETIRWEIDRSLDELGVQNEMTIKIDNRLPGHHA